MSRYFKTPQFSRVGKLFQDLPLEALDRSMTGMNNAYAKNLEKFNLAEASIANIKASKEDEYIKQEKIKSLRERMKAFAESDGFDRADAFVGSLAAEVIGDKDLNHIQRNFQAQEKDRAIYDALRAQGKSAIDARALMNNLGEGENFQSIGVDENGNKIYNEYQGGYMQQLDYDPAKSKLFDQMPERGGTYYVDGPNGSKIAKTWSGIREKDIQDYSEQAFKRYKNSDEYKNEMLNLKVQGYSPEEADQLIQESIMATGMERTGTKSREQMYGYINPLKLQAQAAARRAKEQEEQAPRNTKFIRQSGSTTVEETSPLWDNQASIPRAGFSSVKPSGEVEDVMLDKYYLVKKGDSDDFWSGDGSLNKGTETFKGVRGVSEQGFVWADSEGDHANKLALFGDAAPYDLGKQIPENSVPELDQYGKYFVKDEDGEKHYLKPRNFKKYVEKDSGDIYYKPMNRLEEVEEFGPENVVNGAPIQLGAQKGAYGNTMVDDYDEQYISRSINNIAMDQNASNQYGRAISQTISNKVEQVAAQLDGGLITQEQAQTMPAVKMYNSINNVLAQGKGPAQVLAYMNGRIAASKNKNNGTLDAETLEMAKLLNEILLDYEAGGIKDNTPKQSTVNLYDRDSDGYSGLLED